MALSDKWTRAQLGSAIRREVMDAGIRWWTDAELNQYIEDWQDRVQNEHELVWGSATITATGSSTITFTDVTTDILRVDGIYWNGRRLVYRDKQNLELIDRDWRAFGTTTTPSVILQDNDETITFWPPLATSAVGTIVFEYPQTLTFGSDAATMSLPAWTKYSATNYGAFRCYTRRGPNEDAHKAQRYKQTFTSQLQAFGSRKRNHFPKTSRALRPGTSYEKDILDPFLNISELTMPSNVVTILFEEEAVTGTINGTNTTFTIPTAAPNPPESLELQLDVSILRQDTDYTLSGQTITMLFAPFPGQTLFSRYRYLT